MSLNEKRIKPGAAKPITGIKRQPARNQIGKQADQALSTAREPISMPEGGAAQQSESKNSVPPGYTNTERNVSDSCVSR